MKMLLCVFLMFISFSVRSEIVHIELIPLTWRLENYIGDNVVVWFAGTSCTNGRMTFPASASIADKNRFWSLIMAAKVSSKKIFVRYDNSSESCYLDSFGMDNP